MTVQTSSNSISYIGNGSTTNFDYDFLVLDASHLKAYFGDVLQTSGYTVGGVGSSGGGVVSFTSAPPAGTNVVLVRNVPFLQLTDYRPYDAFPAESHERALDVLTMMAQELKGELERTIQRPVGGNKWDAENNEIINVATGSLGTSAVNLSQLKSEVQNQLDLLNQRSSSIGYIFIGEYAAGLVFKSVKCMTRYGGILYTNSGPFPKTASGVFEADGPWVALSSSTGIFLHSFTATSGQTSVTIDSPVAPGTVPFVFRRGVYQQFGIAYTISSADGKTFEFVEPLEENDAVQILAMSGADATVKGDYTSFIYRNATTTPPTPIGDSPAGWAQSPSTPPSGQSTFVSTARKSGVDSSLIGAWSTPSRFSGETGQQGASVVDIVEVSSKVGKTATYRFLLSDGTYTNTFDVLDGLDGSGSVVSINGVSPGVGGNVTLTASNVGADPSGAATSAVNSHVALTDPHTQYAFRWVNTTDNTGTLNMSSRVRWLADTSAARNRTIGDSVTDLIVKDITGQAGTKNITITAPAGKTINGAATETLDVNYGWVQYTLVGSDFKTIGGQ